ncbi:hypothetical protein V8F06_003267 [Rhypophila decipiens]
MMMMVVVVVASSAADGHGWCIDLTQNRPDIQARPVVGGRLCRLSKYDDMKTFESMTTRYSICGIEPMCCSAWISW